MASPPTKAGGEGQADHSNKKREADGPPKRSEKHDIKRPRQGPTSSRPGAKPLEPCCVECALDYKSFPGLQCSKSLDPEGPCHTCVISHKQCKMLAAGEQRELRKLQRAANGYRINQNEGTTTALDDAHDNFKDFVTLGKGYRGTVNEDALNRFIVEWIYKQDHTITSNMAMLRRLPKQRTSLELKDGQALTTLNLTQKHHLEMILAHLAGNLNDKPCVNCRQEGFFKECVTLKSSDSFGKFKGRCTNCSMRSNQLCILDKPQIYPETQVSQEPYGQYDTQLVQQEDQQDLEMEPEIEDQDLQMEKPQIEQEDSQMEQVDAQIE
ncbi:MAG: hypothetical protein Q9213_005467 [Squamulea squamosa]